MATTVSYSASMRTRKTSSSSNAKTSTACQEYYDSSYNYVGIVNFSGMALSGKVITGISLTVTSEKSGYNRAAELINELTVKDKLTEVDLADLPKLMDKAKEETNAE